MADAHAAEKGLVPSAEAMTNVPSGGSVGVAGMANATPDVGVVRDGGLACEAERLADVIDREVEFIGFAQAGDYFFASSVLPSAPASWLRCSRASLR